MNQILLVNRNQQLDQNWNGSLLNQMTHPFLYLGIDQIRFVHPLADQHLGWKTTWLDIVTKGENSRYIQISYLLMALTFFQCHQHPEVSSLMGQKEWRCQPLTKWWIFICITWYTKWKVSGLTIRLWPLSIGWTRCSSITSTKHMQIHLRVTCTPAVHIYYFCALHNFIIAIAKNA